MQRGLIIGAVLLITAMMACCDFYPDGVTFAVLEDEEFSDGRDLRVKFVDSLFVNILPDGCLPLSPHNLLCRERKDMTDVPDKRGEARNDKKQYLLYFVHRASGRVDTLYDHAVWSERYLMGYVSGYKEHGGWLVIEVKTPGKIVGTEDLCNTTGRDSYGALCVSMTDCTFRGQEKVFESNVVDYWIVNRHTTDLYGPLTMSELKAQMCKLGIPLPMKLDGMYDRYVHPQETPGKSAGKRPKAFYWPHHRSRKGTVIE